MGARQIDSHDGQGRGAVIGENDLLRTAGVPDGAITDRLDPGGRTFTVAGGHASVTLSGRSAAILAP